MAPGPWVTGSEALVEPGPFKGVLKGEACGPDELPRPPFAKVPEVVGVEDVDVEIGLAGVANDETGDSALESDLAIEEFGVWDASVGSCVASG